MEEGKKEGREEGIAQGKKLEALAIARNLLIYNPNFTPLQIANMTGLTEEEIKNLI